MDAAKEALETAVLAELHAKQTIKDSREFLGTVNVEADHDVLVGVLKSLLVSEMVTMEIIESSSMQLTDEGEKYATDGMPEVQVFNGVGPKGISKAELEAKLTSGLVQIGFGVCMKNKWVAVDKTSGVMTQLVSKIPDEMAPLLKALVAGKTLSDADMENLKKRKMVALKKIKSWVVGKGPRFSLERKKLATDITLDMLKGDRWKQEEFKDYNLDGLGGEQTAGALHPLMKVRQQFRNILLEMGFEEMPTNNFVESSFWNFDSLFQPQQHPARDSHDTFFIKNPAQARTMPEAYKERVRKTHETGEFGGSSIGYRYDWDVREAQKNILRTHTTAVSSRMLYKLAQGPFEPKRYFSIDRVFRNETLDATHLAEFHQVEGWIADRNLTLGDLIGTIQEFFRRIGIEEVRFKPAYNPYTEPSMEIFGYSKELNKWMELGNSGIFRPEMLLPMGLPAEVNVIAWGLSLERPTMIKYGIQNIRDLFGPKVKLDIISKNPIARFDH